MGELHKGFTCASPLRKITVDIRKRTFYKFVLMLLFFSSFIIPPSQISTWA